MDKGRCDQPQGSPPAAATAAAAAAADGRDSLRCRKGREGAERELSLLPFPREVMSVVLLSSDGRTLAQATCVSKAMREVVSVKHWESAASGARWLQSPTPAWSAFDTPEEGMLYWRRWGKIASVDPGAPSGRVVVVGGNEISALEASNKTEAFLDVRYGESPLVWRALPRMLRPRSAAAAAVDRLGSIYALGGWNNEGALNYCERLSHPDAASHAASNRQLSGSRRHQQEDEEENTEQARGLVSAANAEIGVDGGNGVTAGVQETATDARGVGIPTPLSSSNGSGSGINAEAGAAETPAPAAGPEAQVQWEALPPLRRRRCFLGAAFVPSGALLAVGGGTGPYRNDTAFETVEVWRPGAETWVRGPSMNIARCGLGVAAMPDGKVFAVGGYGGNLQYLSSAEVLDPGAERWTALAPMKRRRTGVAVVSGPDGRLFAIGGSSDGSHGLSSVETFDPREGKWGTSAPMIVGRAFCCATFAPSGSLYVVGGTSSPTGVMRTAEVFDPRLERWRVEKRFGVSEQHGGRVLTDASIVFQPF
ncbi:unnamed protein product [Scytosiphon promiscuus]